jgi:arylsulfatase A-like enzyme
MSKPNIFFLTIDSLRADKLYGSSKTSVTPNLNSIMKNSVNFSQAISSADQTGTSLASIFTAQFPATTGLTHFNFSSQTETYFNTFKQNGYYLCGFFPDHGFFKNLTENFDDKSLYVYDKIENWKNLYGGIGDSILKKINLLHNHEPWIFSVHIMDLHNPSALPNSFDKSKYGENVYERMLSSIDSWIGKFYKNLNLKNTLFVITSDHGAYIPLKQIPSEIPSIQNFMKKGKKTAPFLEPIGLKLFLLLRILAKKYRTQKLKKKLSDIELRSFNVRGNNELFEETIRVPLLFTGFGISKSKIITDLVRHVDIFPTISELTKHNVSDTKTDGRSLVPLFTDQKMDELPAYIETGVTASQFNDKVNPKSTGKIIGLRTSKYKYLKNRDSTENLHILFDLLDDPMETKNIYDPNSDIASDLDKKLSKLLNKPKKQFTNDLSDDEQQKAEDLLKKLGYV